MTKTTTILAVGKLLLAIDSIWAYTTNTEADNSNHSLKGRWEAATSKGMRTFALSTTK